MHAKLKMNYSRIFVTKRQLILAVCLLLLGFAQEGAAKYGPIIQFEREHLDLGTIEQGGTPKGHFILQNIGDETLIIKEITPSCGCTAAIMDSKEIAPGKGSKIEISVDTTGKELDIGKTIVVTSNDALRPEITLTVALIVEPVEHPDFDIGTSLFSPSCASCHVDSGKGLKGRELYQAICYQCHGRLGEGSSASALNTRKYLEEHSDEYIFNWIAKGKRGTAMAGYGKEHGGFLTQEEINSLVNFLRTLPLPKQEK